MGSFKIRTIVAAIAVSMTSAAYAADLPVIDHTPEVMPAEVGSGWYLRGDIGYGFMRGKMQRSECGTSCFTDSSYEDTWTVGGGVGYKFNQYFRADFTVDYLFPFDGKAVDTCQTCYTGEDANLRAVTFLFNAYLEGGTYHGITPYVGAGIGAALIDAAEHNSITGTGAARSWAPNRRWSLAAALMAGASYELSDNLLVDAGYRFLWLGDGRSGHHTGAGSVSGKVKYEDLMSHQIRVGLRYMID